MSRKRHFLQGVFKADAAVADIKATITGMKNDFWQSVLPS